MKDDDEDEDIFMRPGWEEWIRPEANVSSRWKGLHCMAEKGGALSFTEEKDGFHNEAFHKPFSSYE